MVLIAAVDRRTVQTQAISMFEPHSGSSEHEPGNGCWVV